MIKLKQDFDTCTKDCYVGILENIKIIMSSSLYCPVDELVEAGLVKYVLHFLDSPNRLQLEYLLPALW